MKGKHRIILRTKNLEYDFIINRNITIIRGDSATGKTTFVNIIREYLLGTKGYQVYSDVNINIMDNINWRYQIKNIKNSIIFIDEGNDFINNKDFIREIVNGNDNYFVFINRNDIKQLPYSYKEIYEIKTSGKFHTLKRIYEFDDIDKSKQYNKIITEDSNTGYSIYKDVYKEIYEVMTSNGNSNIYKLLNNNSILIFDGSAIGAEIDRIMEIINKNNLNIYIYAPESFEEDILKSYFGYYDDYDNIDSNYFCSYERYFTDRLTKLTYNTDYQYNKNKVNIWYIRNINKFKKYIKNKIPFINNNSIIINLKWE